MVEHLADKHVANHPNFSKGYFTCEYDGHNLHNLVKIVPHYKWVAGWSRVHNEIYIDNDMLRTIDQRELICLMIHESVEKYVTQHYHLREDSEGHIIADSVEFNWAKKNNIDWDGYSVLVDMVRKKETGRRG